MVFTPETLQPPWLSEPVRWDTFVGHNVYATTRSDLQLYLGQNDRLPTQTRFSFYNKVKTKRRMIGLDAIGIRGMKVNAFLELVGRYLAAAQARRALAKEDLAAVPIVSSVGA